VVVMLRNEKSCTQNTTSVTLIAHTV
jgi:hypothetical protein